MERYKEYKDSGVKWLGEIPSHWEVKRLANFFSERREKVSDQDYAPLSVTKQGIFPQLDNVAKTNDGDNRKLVKRGDFVINSRSDRKGSSGVSELDGSVSLINLVLQPRKTLFGPFCNYLLKSYGFIEENYRNGRGIVADLWTTRYDEMKMIKVALPSLEEQKTISSYLDTATSEIDKAIAMQQKMIDLLNERKQIIIQNAVTKGLDENVEMKESGVEWIGSIPKHWKVRKIKTVANFNPLPQRKFQQDEIVGYLPMERLGLGSMNPSEISYGKMPVGLNYIEDGDVVIAKVTPCFENGKIAIAKNLKNGCAFGTSEIYVYRPIKIDSVFLLYSLQNEQLKNKCASTMMGTGGLKRVNASFAKNVYITFPPTEKEQNEIGLFLENKISTFNKTIENIQRQITLLQERKQIIINEVVTGKVRVS